MLQVINITPGAILSFVLLLIGVISIVFSMFKSASTSSFVKACMLHTLCVFVVMALVVSSHYTQLHIVHILLVFLLVCILQIHLDFNSLRVSNYSVYFLVIASVIGTLYAGEANNFIAMYLGFETISFVGYILVALLPKKPLTSEGAVKYFLIGGIASAIMIFGISLIYGVSGSVEFSAIPIEKNPMLIMGLALFLFGVLFKLTAFPLHFWAPDVYCVTNLPSLGVIAVLPKIAALLAFANIVPYINSNLLPVITICAILSIIIGSFGGVFQTNIQKILAYSGIANIGYIFSTYSLAGFSISVVLEFIAIYSISVIFLLIILVNINKNFGYNGTILSIRGLYKTNPALASLLTIALLNIAGIPPLCGFFAKYIIIRQFLNAQQWALPIIIVLSSAVTLFYYLKIIKNMYFETPSAELELYKSVSIAFGSKVCIFCSIIFLFSYSYLGYNEKYQMLIQNFYKQGENVKIIS